MLVVTIVAASWIVRRFAVSFKVASRLRMGLIACALLFLCREQTITLCSLCSPLCRGW
jgi:hypothetical protein